MGWIDAVSVDDLGTEMLLFEKAEANWAESALVSKVNGPSHGCMLDSLSKQMPLEYAVRQVSKLNLPEDVALAVRESRNSKVQQPFETSPLA